MNIALVDSELNYNFRLFCKTVSNSANWGFDRFRLYNPKWHTKVQVRRPDGSVVATQAFADNDDFEHTFSFDLSENVNKKEYSVYVAGVPAGQKFVQVYAYPSGYGGTYGRNAELSFWDFSQVNLVNGGANGVGRIRFENNPITSFAGLNLLAASEINFTNCHLDAETLADALISIDNSGVLNGSFKYSGNLAAPAERALNAYNSLKNKSWNINGEVPAKSSMLLDSAPAKAAYSLEQLSSYYDGYAVRVRRNSDNQELDISFSYKKLDTETLQNFVGDADAFVTTWYDQSGNNQNLTQSSGSSQPCIMKNGNLIVRNGRIALDFDNQYLTNSNRPFWSFLHDGTKTTIAQVKQLGKSDRPGTMTNLGTNIISSGDKGIGEWSDNDNLKYFYANVVSGAFPVNFNEQNLFVTELDLSNTTASKRLKVYQNSENLNPSSENTFTGMPSSNASNRDFSVGETNSNYPFKGFFQELIMWANTFETREFEVNITERYNIN